MPTDEIEVELPGLSKYEIHRRAIWIDGDGEKSYTWESTERDARVGMLGRVIAREAVRKGILPKLDYSSHFPTIYHYTTSASFVKIIESGELWLSDYSYLNDRAELVYGADLALNRFKKVAESKAEATAKILEKWASSLFDENPRICVASFSMDGDSLSQWRAYGQLAIGFEYSPLMFGYNNTTRADLVIYDSTTQERLLDLSAQLVACAYENDAEKIPDRVDEIYENGGSRIVETISFFKHPAFADEREFRIVHSEYPHVYKSMPFLDRAPYRFRESTGIIVPYVTTRDLADSDVSTKYPEQLPIREIVIGPGADADSLERGINALLKVKGYQEVVVRRSTAPLR
ncbi:MAG: DUF2971 domain-containing protein [Minwuiales bacterium]|nr:DUF2971 domain-containing protein [Minwuiales bacterium]